MNQGVIGGGAMMGHRTTEKMLRLGMEHRDDVQARFVPLPSWSRRHRVLARPVPLLARHNLDLHITRWHLAEALRARSVVQREIRDFAPAAVHVSSHAASFLLGGMMTRLPYFLAVDSPVVEHETARSARQRALGPSLAMERNALTQARAVLAFHRWTAAAVSRAAPEATVEVLHPGIDVETFRPAARVGGDRRRILFVGGDFAAKGGHELLSALDPRLGDDLLLDVVTATALPRRPGVQVHRLGAGDPRLVELFQQADLLCLPTHRDAGPWVILEAMACCTPVVASDVGAIPELIGDSGAGLLVAPRRPAELRQAVEALLADDSRLQGLGARGRQFVERNFDARIQVDRLLELMLDRAAVSATGPT